MVLDRPILEAVKNWEMVKTDCVPSAGWKSRPGGIRIRSRWSLVWFKKAEGQSLERQVMVWMVWMVWVDLGKCVEKLRRERSA
jgi:hypothetical protein